MERFVNYNSEINSELCLELEKLIKQACKLLNASDLQILGKLKRDIYLKEIKVKYGYQLDKLRG